MFTYLKMEQKKTNQELNEKSQTGLTPTQKIFVILCHKMGIPNKQIGICIDILTDQELRVFLEWVGMETDNKGRLLTMSEMTEKLYELMMTSIKRKKQ